MPSPQPPLPDADATRRGAIAFGPAVQEVPGAKKFLGEAEFSEDVTFAKDILLEGGLSGVIDSDDGADFALQVLAQSFGVNNDYAAETVTIPWFPSNLTRSMTGQPLRIGGPLGEAGWGMGRARYTGSIGNTDIDFMLVGLLDVDLDASATPQAPSLRLGKNTWYTGVFPSITEHTSTSVIAKADAVQLGGALEAYTPDGDDPFVRLRGALEWDASLVTAILRSETGPFRFDSNVDGPELRVGLAHSARFVGVGGGEISAPDGMALTASYDDEFAAMLVAEIYDNALSEALPMVPVSAVHQNTGAGGYEYLHVFGEMTAIDEISSRLRVHKSGALERNRFVRDADSGTVGSFLSVGYPVTFDAIDAATGMFNEPQDDAIEQITVNTTAVTEKSIIHLTVSNDASIEGTVMGDRAIPYIHAVNAGSFVIRFVLFGGLVNENAWARNSNGARLSWSVER